MAKEPKSDENGPRVPRVSPARPGPSGQPGPSARNGSRGTPAKPVQAQSTPPRPAVVEQGSPAPAAAKPGQASPAPAAAKAQPGQASPAPAAAKPNQASPAPAAARAGQASPAPAAAKANPGSPAPAAAPPGQASPAPAAAPPGPESPARAAAPPDQGSPAPAPVQPGSASPAGAVAQPGPSREAPADRHHFMRSADRAAHGVESGANGGAFPAQQPTPPAEVEEEESEDDFHEGANLACWLCGLCDAFVDPFTVTKFDFTGMNNGKILQFLADLMLKNLEKVDEASGTTPKTMGLSTAAVLDALVMLYDLTGHNTRDNFTKFFADFCNPHEFFAMRNFITEFTMKVCGSTQKLVHLLYKGEDVFDVHKTVERRMRKRHPLHQQDRLMMAMDFLCDEGGDYFRTVVNGIYRKRMRFPSMIPAHAPLKYTCRLAATYGHRAVLRLDFRSSRLCGVGFLHAEGAVPVKVPSVALEGSFKILQNDSHLVVQMAGQDPALVVLLIQPTKPIADFLQEMPGKMLKIAKEVAPQERKLVVPVFDEPIPLTLRDLATAKRFRLGGRALLARRTAHPLARAFSTNKAEFGRMVTWARRFGMQNAYPLHDVYWAANLVVHDMPAPDKHKSAAEGVVPHTPPRPPPQELVEFQSRTYFAADNWFVTLGKKTGAVDPKEFTVNMTKHFCQPSRPGTQDSTQSSGGRPVKNDTNQEGNPHPPEPTPERIARAKAKAKASAPLKTRAETRQKMLEPAVVAHNDAQPAQSSSPLQKAAAPAKTPSPVKQAPRAQATGTPREFHGVPRKGIRIRQLSKVNFQSTTSCSSVERKHKIEEGGPNGILLPSLANFPKLQRTRIDLNVATRRKACGLDGEEADETAPTDLHTRHDHENGALANLVRLDDAPRGDDVLTLNKPFICCALYKIDGQLLPLYLSVNDMFP